MRRYISLRADLVKYAQIYLTVCRFS